MHEGTILYCKYWNFWVRAGIKADTRSYLFFRDYERKDNNITKLLTYIGYTSNNQLSEKEIWNKIGIVWNWLKKNVQLYTTAYSLISSQQNAWPSIQDYSKYFVKNGNLIWAACFTKAHLFATLLGRIIEYPRYRFALASCHHTEGGAPSTASHCYVAAYIFDRWFYFDPTVVPVRKFPSYKQRKSIGVSSYSTIDYGHPFDLIPLPAADFNRVPHLPS